MPGQRHRGLDWSSALSKNEKGVDMNEQATSKIRPGDMFACMRIIAVRVQRAGRNIKDDARGQRERQSKVLQA